MPRAAMQKGTDAMASPRARLAQPSTLAQLGQLWQVPLLLLSVALFGYAAYLFIDPKPGLSIEQKIQVARDFLGQERPKAALAQLRNLLETEKLETPQQATIHLLTAEGLDMGQKQLPVKIGIN